MSDFRRLGYVIDLDDAPTRAYLLNARNLYPRVPISLRVWVAKAPSPFKIDAVGLLSLDGEELHVTLPEYAGGRVLSLAYIEVAERLSQYD